MKKQEIVVEGLPEGCEAVAVQFEPNYFNKYTGDDGFVYFEAKVKVKKIQPRRIKVFEETEEFATIEKRGYVLLDGGTLEFKRRGDTISPPHKLWREVKETDIPRKKSLSVADAKELLNYLPSNTDFYKELVEFIGDKS